MAKKTPPGFISKADSRRNTAARQKSEPAAPRKGKSKTTPDVEPIDPATVTVPTLTVSPGAQAAIAAIAAELATGHAQAENACVEPAVIVSSSSTPADTILVTTDPAINSQESPVEQTEQTGQTGETNSGGDVAMTFKIDLENPTSADGKGWGYVYKPENPDVRGSVRISKSLFKDAPPATLREALAVVEAAKPKPVLAKMTPEQRKAARDAAPKLTLAQKIAKRKAALDKLIAKAAKEEQAALTAGQTPGTGTEQPSA